FSPETLLNRAHVGSNPLAVYPPLAEGCRVLCERGRAAGCADRVNEGAAWFIPHFEARFPRA
ncbi:hypothetical protein OE165_27715, partial [Escherichia coli]|uniref:hypothetical protein n=1 Tax=Escherichia coli TaxID=562 RepID=UPI0021F399B2